VTADSKVSIPVDIILKLLYFMFIAKVMICYVMISYVIVEGSKCTSELDLILQSSWQFFVLQNFFLNS